MYLLVIITQQENRMYEFLKLLPATGVRGATVIEGHGMVKMLHDRRRCSRRSSRSLMRPSTLPRIS